LYHNAIFAILSTLLNGENNMKMMIIALVGLLAISLEAAETNKQDDAFVDLVLRLTKPQPLEAPMYLSQEGERILVRIMEPLETEATRRFLPKTTIYRLISSNDPIHRANFSCLIIHTNGTPRHLQTDQDVINYIGNLTREVQNKNDALQLIQLFADLRSYRIVLSPPGKKDCRKPEDRPKPSPFDYKFMVDEGIDYRIHATMMVDAYSGSYVRFAFALHKASGSGVDIAESSLIHVRNYVY
jgi:hypothetical protein